MTRQLYTTINRAALADILEGPIPYGDKTIQELVDSNVKRERTYGRRLQCLYVLNENSPGIIADLRSRNDWHEIRAYKEINGLVVKIVRNHAQARALEREYNEAQTSARWLIGRALLDYVFRGTKDD